MDYKKAYFTLFNGVSDTIEFMEKEHLRIARKMLIMAQRRAEMFVISQPSEEDEVVEEDESMGEDEIMEEYEVMDEDEITGEDAQ